MSKRRSPDALIGQARVPYWRGFLAALVPGTVLTLSLVFGAVPLASVAWAMMIPDFFAPVLFFWCVHRPQAIPILLVFVLGVTADILHDSPMGVHALSYVALAIGAKASAPQLVSLGLLFNWILFSLLMIGVGLIKLITSMIGTPGVVGFPALPAILQSLQLVLTTIVAYPLVHLVLVMFSKTPKGSRELRQNALI